MPPKENQLFTSSGSIQPAEHSSEPIKQDIQLAVEIVGINQKTKTLSQLNTHSNDRLILIGLCLRNCTHLTTHLHST